MFPALNVPPPPFVSLRPVRFHLGLPVLLVVDLLGQARGHGGRLDHGFEAALPLLDVLLWVEDDHVDLGDVEHAQGHGGAQAHGDGQGGGLDEHLETEKHKQGIWEQRQGSGEQAVVFIVFFPFFPF